MAAQKQMEVEYQRRLRLERERLMSAERDMAYATKWPPTPPWVQEYSGGPHDWMYTLILCISMLVGVCWTFKKFWKTNPRTCINVLEWYLWMPMYVGYPAFLLALKYADWLGIPEKYLPGVLAAAELCLCGSFVFGLITVRLENKIRTKDGKPKLSEFLFFVNKLGRYGTVFISFAIAGAVMYGQHQRSLMGMLGLVIVWVLRRNTSLLMENCDKTGEVWTLNNALKTRYEKFATRLRGVSANLKTRFDRRKEKAVNSDGHNGGAD